MYQIDIDGQLYSPNPADGACLALSLQQRMGAAGSEAQLLLAGGLPAPAAEATVSISIDDNMVFTGHIEGWRGGVAQAEAHCGDALALLARADTEAVYEDMSAGDIISALLDEAGLEAGEILAGPQIPRYCVHRGARLLRQLEALAQLSGADWYCDSDGKIQVVAGDWSGTSHTATWAENLLDSQLQRVPPSIAGYTIWGEGAAGSQGAEKFFWLPSSLDAVSGESGESSRMRRLHSGALRSAEAAQAMADGLQTRSNNRNLVGNILLIGDASLQLGDSITVAELPDTQAQLRDLVDGQTLKIRAIRHLLDNQQGFRTRVEVVA
jgi:hypothetical protein